MPNHHHGHGPPPHGRHEWIENEEKDRSLDDIGSRLMKIGELLSERGTVTIGASTIQPPGTCRFILRYERLHHGELSLKMELFWADRQTSDASTALRPDLSIS